MEVEHILTTLPMSDRCCQESQIEKTDVELLAELKQGNSRALSELFRRYESDMIGYLSRRFGDLELAKDITQDTFMRLIKRPPRECQDGSIKPWLHRVARNLGIDTIRKQSRLTTVDTIPEGELQTNDPSVLKSEASELVRGLPKAQLEVVLLRIYADMKFNEIAEQLDIPVSTALWRMRQALQTIKKSLEEDML